MGIFDFLTGGGNDSNPANAANPYLDQIPGMVKQNYNPYIARGNTAYDRFNPILNSMSSNPAAFLESIMKGYAPSRGFQLENNELLKDAGNTAAAGGMRGSINDINHEAKITDMLMGKDMQDWLTRVLGIQDSGMKGQEHLYDTGYDATKGMTGDISNVLGTQASLGFQGQREDNQRNSDFMSGLSKLLGAGAGGYFGGVEGAKVGSNVGSSFF